MGSIKEDAGNIIQKLLHQLQKAEKYGDRKGAAYGLAGMVKGLGILSLKQYDIMNTLTVAIQEKKNYKYREGRKKLQVFKSIHRISFNLLFLL